MAVKQKSIQAVKFEMNALWRASATSCFTKVSSLMHAFAGTHSKTAVCNAKYDNAFKRTREIFRLVVKKNGAHVDVLKKTSHVIAMRR